MKDVLIYKKTKGVNELSVLSEEEAEHLSDIIEIRKLHEMIGTFLKLQLDFKTASNVKTLFEVALLKLLTYEDTTESEPISKPVQHEQKREIHIEPKQEVRINPFEEPKPEPKPEIKVEPAVDFSSNTVEQKPQSVPEIKPAPVEVKPEPPKVEEAVDETVAPDWLVDDDDKKKSVENDGEKYELDDEMIIKLMVLGDKELRKTITGRWDELNAYLGHPTFGDLVALLKDGSPFIVTKKVVVLLYDFEKLASRANVKANSDRLSEILHMMLGYDVFVYGISRSESVRLLTAYQNLRQISRLPLPKDIHITLGDLRK